MRTHTTMMPMTLILPVSYSLSVKMDGDQSSVTIKETYPPDVPLDMVDKSMVVCQSLFPKVVVQKISNYEIELTLRGPEWAIARAIISEFEMWLDSPLSPPPPLLAPRGNLQVSFPEHEDGRRWNE